MRHPTRREQTAIVFGRRGRPQFNSGRRPFDFARKAVAVNLVNDSLRIGLDSEAS